MTGFERMRSMKLGLAAALAVGAFLVSLAPLSDGDLWWHLAAGREIVQTGALPTVDVFSSGAAGRPWIDVHWGFQLAAYGLHALGGLTALVVAKGLLVAIGALVLFGAVGRSAGPRARPVLVVALLAALFAARGLLLLRPVIPTLLFLALTFSLLERFRREGRLALLAPLPLLQLAWANVQGLSMLGPALVAAYALAMAASVGLGGRRWFPFAVEAPEGTNPKASARALFVTLALCVAACGATPYGLRGLQLPFELLHRLTPGAANIYAANVAENVPPWALERAAPGQFGHLAWFLGLCALSLLSARRPLLSHLIILLGLVGLALMANRNVLLLYWLGTPIAVIAATPALRRLRIASRTWRGPLAARWVGRAALAGLLVTTATAAAREPSLAEAAPWRAPVGSARAIAARVGSGTIFAADQFGGYLIWQLAPRFRPYMDTRLVLRSPEEFAEYLSLVDEPARFDAWEERHPVDYVVLPVGYPDRYLGLIGHLYASDRWALIYTDGAETLFARRSDAVGKEALEKAWDLGSDARIDPILGQLDRRFGGAPRLREAARLQLATLEMVVGQAGQAERVLADLQTPSADALRARGRLARGDLDGAQRIAEALLGRDADDVGSLDVLAVISARRGDASRAVGYLRRALEVNPFDGEAGQLLASLEDHAKSR
jgi:tetratricopeptide (TPR) repeat protein